MIAKTVQQVPQEPMVFAFHAAQVGTHLTLELNVAQLYPPYRLASQWVSKQQWLPSSPGVLFNPLRAVRRARFANSFYTALAPFLSRLSLLGVTLGGLEMQLSGPKTDFGAQGAP